MTRYYFDTEPGILALLIRHASTEDNDPNNPRVRGWADIPLAPNGEIEAQLAGEKLKQYGIKQLYHSDFMRDSQTAHIIANKLNIQAEADFNARTWDTGSFSGQTEEDVNPAIIEIYKNPWKAAPGGGESFNGFLERWYAFLDAKLSEAANVPSSRPLGIVTHGRNIASAQSYIEFIPPLKCEMPCPAGFAIISVALDRSLHLEVMPPKELVIQDV